MRSDIYIYIYIYTHTHTHTAVIGRVITQKGPYVMCCHCGALFGYLLSITDLNRHVETLIIWEDIDLTSQLDSRTTMTGSKNIHALLHGPFID